MTTQDIRVSAFTLRASAGSTRQSTLTWRDAGGADYPIDDHELTVLVDGDEMDVELDGNVATVTWVFPDDLGPVPLQVLLDGVPQTSGQVVLSRLGTDLFVGDVDVVVAPLSFTVEVVGGGVSQSDLNSVVVDLADEATARAGADFNLGQSIASEASARAAADSALSSAVSSEASTRATADGTLTTNLAAEVAARTALGASLPATYAAFINLARHPESIISGAITRDINGAATSAPVSWPDGSTGTYTATTVSTAFPGAVDAYTVTYGSPVTRTFTQPAVTRDGNGAVTNRPTMAVT